MSDYIERTKAGTVFTGSDVNIFRAAAIASALRLYANTGMKVNRAYTPTAMLKAANEILGTAYKRGDYMAASLDLSAWVEGAKRRDREG